MKKVTHCHGVADTAALAGKLAQTAKAGMVIALHGDLGAGKTAFARAFARTLGISEPVTSPTFTILQEYPVHNGLRFCHFDLYRIDSPGSALDFGFDEFLNATDTLCMIEWPERAAVLLPEETIHVWIERPPEYIPDPSLADDEPRIITIIS